MATLTYGSFGDIITTVQLAWRLAQALSEARGSATKFQDLIGELHVFHRTLNQLMLFWQTRAQCPELDALADLLKPTVVESQSTIEKFLEKALKKYGHSLLRPAGTKKRIGDVARAIQWHLCEAGEVRELRDKLRWRAGIVQLMQERAKGITQEQNQDILVDRLVLISDAQRQVGEDIDRRLDELIDKLEAQSAVTQKVDAKIDIISSDVVSADTRLRSVQTTVTHIDQRLASLPQMLGGLCLYTQNTAYIEDALGWTIPLPLDYIKSWETVESIINDRFMHRPGRELVTQRRYALQDTQTGKDLQRNVPFHVAAHPGQKVGMSMIFHGGGWAGADQQSVCPRCGHVDRVADPELDVACGNKKCGLFYRRVLDVSDLDEEAIVAWWRLGSATDESRRLAFEVDAKEDDEDYQQRITERLQREAAADDPEVFKRVRFISRWEDLEESRGHHMVTLGNTHIWNMASHGFASMAQFQIALAAVLHCEHYLDYLGGDEGLDYDDPRNYLYYHVFFIGTTRQKSVPAFIIASHSKRRRSRALKVMRQLSYLRPGSSSFLLISLPTWVSISRLRQLDVVLRNPESFNSRIYRKADELKEMM